MCTSRLNKLHFHFLKVFYLWTRKTKKYVFEEAEGHGAMGKRGVKRQFRVTLPSSLYVLFWNHWILALKTELWRSPHSLHFSKIMQTVGNWSSSSNSSDKGTTQFPSILSIIIFNNPLCWEVLLSLVSLFFLSLQNLISFLVFCLLNLNIPKGRGRHIIVSFPSRSCLSIIWKVTTPSFCFRGNSSSSPRWKYHKRPGS